MIDRTASSMRAGEAMETLYCARPVRAMAKLRTRGGDLPAASGEIFSTGNGTSKIIT
jgi:hypothetical protein